MSQWHMNRKQGLSLSSIVHKTLRRREYDKRWARLFILVHGIVSGGIRGCKQSCILVHRVRNVLGSTVRDYNRHLQHMFIVHSCSCLVAKSVLVHKVYRPARRRTAADVVYARDCLSYTV